MRNGECPHYRLPTEHVSSIKSDVQCAAPKNIHSKRTLAASNVMTGGISLPALRFQAGSVNKSRHPQKRSTATIIDIPHAALYLRRREDQVAMDNVCIARTPSVPLARPWVIWTPAGGRL
jgi:hypothetical protein